VKRFFDTTVLVAAVLEEHEHYERSHRAFSTASRSSAFCAAHNLAEVYVALTRYPGKQRLSADQALVALEVIGERLTIVVLDVNEYVAAIRRFAAIGIIGGTLYDGLIASCALKVEADVLYTWNTDHFLRLGEDIARLVRTP
jgi:predicted nucleic acid-binding protein